MAPISFLAFRDQLNPASGFQSMQFREIEFASGLKHESLLNEFREDDLPSRIAAAISETIRPLEMQAITSDGETVSALAIKVANRGTQSSSMASNAIFLVRRTIIES